MRLRLVVGVESDRPWEILRIGKARRASRGKKLRHVLVVEIFLNRGIRRRANDLEGGENFITFCSTVFGGLYASSY
jgi:hypothetical protein